MLFKVVFRQNSLLKQMKQKRTRTVFNVSLLNESSAGNFVLLKSSGMDTVLHREIILVSTR